MMASQIQLITQSLPKTRRLRRPRRARDPRGIERSFAAEVKRLNDETWELVETLLLPRLGEIARMAGVRSDDLRVDQSGWSAVLREIFKDIRTRLGAVDPRIRDAANEAAEQTSLFNRREISRQMRSVVGVDIFYNEPQLLETLEEFTEANVAAIKSVPEQFLTQIQQIISNGFRSGRRASELAKEIGERFGVSKSRAQFIARDQISSLNAQLTKQRQQAIGIEEYIWRTSRDERVRASHAALEGTKHSWDDPPTVGNRQVHPGEDYNCLESTMKVVSPTPVSVAYRRFFRGSLTELVTVFGEPILSTENHPILTTRGVLPAKDVEVGDYLVDASLERTRFSEKDVEDTEATIAQVFDFLALLFPTKRVGGLASQFHGDGLVDEEVEVVRPYRDLDIEEHPSLSQGAAETLLAVADVFCDPTPADRDFVPVLIALGFPPDRIVRRFGKALALGLGGLRHPGQHSVATIAWLNAAADKMGSNRGPGDPILLRQILDALTSGKLTANALYRYLFGVVRRSVWPPNRYPSLAELTAEVVAIDTKLVRQLGNGVSTSAHETGSVVEKRIRKDFAGHVYNLATESGWYVAQGAVVGNCRCTAEPVIEGVEPIKTSPKDVPPPIEVRKKAEKPTAIRDIPTTGEAKTVRLPRTGKRVRLSADQARRSSVARVLGQSPATRQAATTGQRLDRLLWSWVHGSSRKTSVEFKKAAIREFRLRGIAFNPRRFTIPDADISQSAKDLRALYRATQRYLREQGKKTIKVYRGIKGGVAERGAIESWSTSKATAEKFAGPKGHVLVEDVPIDRVLTLRGGPHWMDGVFGDQGEVVIMF